MLGVCALALAGLAGAAGGLDFGLIADPYVQHALRFTLLQAALSTLLSLTLGALIALALARRRFPLRGAVIASLGALFVLPSIVAILGLVALYGRSGLVNAALHKAGVGATLALLQIFTILIFFLALESITPRKAAAPAQDGGTGRSDTGSLATRILDAIAFSLAALVVAGPVIGAVISAASGTFGAILSDPAFYRALAGSLAIALPAGLLSAALATAIAYGVAHLQTERRSAAAARALSSSASALLIVPPFALAAGLFIALRPLADPAAMVMPLVALVNALTALPIALRIIGPPVLTNAERHGRLAASLGVSGLARLRLIEAPLLRAPLGLALATVIAFSIGDLGVAALFGMGDTMTLPLYVYSLIGSYRMEQGGAAALLLCGLIAALFPGIEFFARGRRRA